MSFPTNNFLHCLMSTGKISDQVSFCGHSKEVSGFIILVNLVIGHLNFCLQLTLSTAGIVLFAFVLAWFFDFFISLSQFYYLSSQGVIFKRERKNLESPFLKIGKIHTSTLPILSHLNDLKYSHAIFSSTQQSEIY